MKPTRRIRVALAATLLLLLAPACHRRPAAAPARSPAVGVEAGNPQPGGQVVVAVSADVTTFNEYQSTGEKARGGSSTSSSRR